VLTGLAAILIPSAAILSRNPTRFFWFLLLVSIPVHVDLEIMSHPEHYAGARSFYLDAVTMVAAGLVCFALVRVLARRERIEWVRSPVWPALLLYFLVAAISIPGSPAPLLGSMELLRMGEELLLVFAVGHLLRSREDIVFIVVAMLAIMLGESLLGLLQFASDRFVNLSFIGGAATTMVDEFGRQAHHRVAGTYLHPVLFGSYLATHLSLIVALLCAARGVAQRWSLLGLFVAGLVALVLTFSRAGWISFAVASVSVVVLAARSGLLSRKQMGFLFGVGSVLALVGLCFSGLIYSRLFESNPANLSARFASFQDAWLMFLAHPLTGVGLNNYVEAIPSLYGTTADGIPAHNYFLLTLAETGATGLIAFLLLLGAIAWEGRRSLSVSDPLMRAIAVGLLGAIIAYLVDLMGGFALRFSAMSTLFWFLVGLLIAARACDARSERAA
jgi:O-antigen ligase